MHHQRVVAGLAGEALQSRLRSVLYHFVCVLAIPKFLRLRQVLLGAISLGFVKRVLQSTLVRRAPDYAACHATTREAHKVSTHVVTEAVFPSRFFRTDFGAAVVVDVLPVGNLVPA